MNYYLSEKLEIINSNPSEFPLLEDNVVKNIFRLATLDNLKFKLPKGILQPTKSNNTNVLGLSEITLESIMGKMYLFFNPSKLTDEQRKLKFIEYYEGLCPEDQEIFVAIKDQELHLLYKNITQDLMRDYLL